MVESSGVPTATFGSYYKQLWRAGKREGWLLVRRLLPWESAITMGLLGIYAALVLPAWTYPHPTDEMETVIWGAVTAAILLAVLTIGTFLWALAWAPVNLSRRDARALSESEIRKHEALEQMAVATSRLAVLKASVRVEHIADSDWYRILVHNASEVAQAKDVIVKLQSIEPSPLAMNPCPGPLGVKGGMSNSANPGDGVLFDLISTLTGSLVFRLWTVEFAAQEFTLEDKDYTVTITVSADNANAFPKRLRLRQPYRRDEQNYLQPDGELQLEMLADAALQPVSHGAAGDKSLTPTPAPEPTPGTASP